MTNRRSVHLFLVASRDPSKRRFERLNDVVNEKIPFSIVKISHSTSTVFDGNVYDGIDRRLVLAEFEGNGDESNLIPNNRWNDVLFGFQVYACSWKVLNR